MFLLHGAKIHMVHWVFKRPLILWDNSQYVSALRINNLRPDPKTLIEVKGKMTSAEFTSGLLARGNARILVDQQKL